MKVELYTPKPWQRDVHACLQQHPTSSIIVIKSHRQCGKSMMLENMLLHAAFTNNNSTSIVLHPTQKQGRKMFKDVVTAIYSSKDGGKLVTSANSTNLTLTFINGSEVIFLSAEQGEALRGYTVKNGGVFVIDEAAYISDDVFGMVSPFVDVHRAPMVMVSTPRFRTGFFYDHYTLGLQGAHNIYAFDFSKYDTSEFLPKDKVEQYRRTLSTQKFQSEILGEFMDLQGSVFGDFGCCLNNAYDGSNKDIYIGIDWGSGQGADYTVLSAFNSAQQMVTLDYFNTLEPLQAIERIVEHIARLAPVRVQVELNGIGDTYYKLLQQSMRSHGLATEIAGFITDNNSKNRIIENMQVQLQNKSVTLFNDPELVQQFSMYEQERTPQGRITYNASSGYHDDIVMASAIALDAMSVADYAVL